MYTRTIRLKLTGPYFNTHPIPPYFNTHPTSPIENNIVQLFNCVLHQQEENLHSIPSRYSLHLFTGCKWNSSFIQAEAGTIPRGLAQVEKFMSKFESKSYSTPNQWRRVIILKSSLWISEYWFLMTFWNVVLFSVTDALITPNIPSTNQIAGK